MSFWNSVTAATKNLAEESSKIASQTAAIAVSASSSVTHNINNLVADGYGIKDAECGICGAKSETTAASMAYNISTGRLHNFQRCVICNKRHCSKCIRWSRYRIPENLCHQHRAEKAAQSHGVMVSVHSSTACGYNTITNARKYVRGGSGDRVSSGVRAVEDWVCVSCQVSHCCPMSCVHCEGVPLVSVIHC